MKKMLCIALVGLVSVYVHAADDTMNGQLNPIATAEADSSNMAQAGLALVSMLTQNLGVTEAQAAGGMGSIFQAVQGVMSTSDFNSLSKAVPNMDSLL